MGFNSEYGLSTLTSKQFDQIETFAQTTIPTIIDEVDLPKYLGLFSKKPSSFRLMPGQRNLIEKLIDTAKSNIKSSEKTERRESRKSNLNSANEPRKRKNSEEQNDAACSKSQKSNDECIEIETQHLSKMLVGWCKKQPGVSQVGFVQVFVTFEEGLYRAKALCVCAGCKKQIPLMKVKNRWSSSNYHAHIKTYLSKELPNQQHLMTRFVHTHNNSLGESSSGHLAISSKLRSNEPTTSASENESAKNGTEEPISTPTNNVSSNSPSTLDTANCPSDMTPSVSPISTQDAHKSSRNF